MATPGARTAEIHRDLAGSLLRLARSERGWSQRELAVAAGLPASTVGVIEAGRRQPSLPVLLRLLAAADLDLRLQLAPYDDHDDVLDAREARRSEGDRVDDEVGWAVLDRAVIGPAGSELAGRAAVAGVAAAGARG